MKNQHINKQTSNYIPFKDSFTLKQYSAFSLIFNWMLPSSNEQENATQYKKLTQTHHFRNLYQNREEYDFKSLLTKLRHYFSHYVSSWPEEQISKSDLSDLSDELDFLVREAIAILEQRNKKLDQDEKQEEAIKSKFEEMKDSSLEFFPLENSKNIQPTLALIASPFLTKSQMSFLSDKFFKGKDITKEPPHYLAIKKVLETLSQNDRVLLDSSQNFISPKKETAFAIWSRLEAVGLYNTKDETIEETFPEDQWFMKQLVLYLEYEKALPNVKFARIQTQRNQETNQLEQEKSFSSDSKDPLRIRNNTIEAEISLEGEAPYRTNFGLHALKYLVIAHINQKPINQLILDHFKENKTRKGKEYKFYSISERLTKRVEYLITKYKSWDSEKIKLNQQIRWICYFINQAWKQKKDRFMNAEEFKKMQKEIRHYRQRAFYKILNEESLCHVNKLGLGEDDQKTLSDFKTHTRIQNFFDDLLKTHLEWLKNTQRKIAQMSDLDQKELAIKLKVNHQTKNRPNHSLSPVAIPFQEVKKWLEEDTKKRFFYHVRELCKNNLPSLSLFGLRKEQREGKKIISGQRKAKENLARVGLLSQMIKQLLEEQSLQIFDKQQKPSEHFVTETLNPKIKIKFKLTQGWRNYAKEKTKFLIKLIKVYHKKDFEGTLDLLKKTKNNNEPSIQSLKQKLNKERYLLIQALFKFEKKVVKEKNLENSGDYLPFKDILNKSDVSTELHEEINKLRGALFT